jgi:hypothetical protein
VGTVPAFDTKKLTTVDWVIVGAGGVALISLFLPWYGYSSNFGSVSDAGFGTSYGWLGSLLIIAAAVYLFLVRSDVDIKGPVGPAVAVLGASALGTVIVLIRWLSLPRASGAFGAVHYSYGAKFGMWLTLIVGIVQVVSSFMLFRASGEQVPWGAHQAGTGAGSAPAA